jgi:hypothetical protein
LVKSQHNFSVSWKESLVQNNDPSPEACQELEADNSIQCLASNTTEKITIEPKTIKKESWSCGFFTRSKTTMNKPRESIERPELTSCTM